MNGKTSFVNKWDYEKYIQIAFISNSIVQQFRYSKSSNDSATTMRTPAKDPG